MYELSENDVIMGPTLMIASGPDFTILNPQTGKVVFWEHLGMVDNAEYVEKNLKKFRDYEKTGIFLGEELLVTVETQQMPLNSKGIEAFICKHFGKN